MSQNGQEPGERGRPPEDEFAMFDDLDDPLRLVRFIDRVTDRQWELEDLEAAAAQDLEQERAMKREMAFGMIEVVLAMKPESACAVRTWLHGNERALGGSLILQATHAVHRQRRPVPEAAYATERFASVRDDL